MTTTTTTALVVIWLCVIFGLERLVENHSVAAATTTQGTTTSSSPTHCDASEPPQSGDVGNCTSTLPIGETCKPSCEEGFVLANGGKQTRCASDGKLSYRAECVYDGCYVIERNAPAAQARKTKPMNEIITHPDGKSEKTVLVSKDEREIHVNVDAVHTRAKLVSYANASANNLVVRKRLFAQGENEDVDVGKRLAELRKKAAELRERLLRVKYRYTPPPSPPPSPPSPPPSPSPSPPPSPAPLFLTSLVEDANQPKIYASDAAASDGFGVSVSLYGNTALIGASKDDNNVLNSGSVYVFTRSSVDGTFTQQAKLYADDAAAGDYFGISVSLYDNTALIGAHLDDDNGFTSSGSVYVFTRSGVDGTFTHQAKLHANDAAAEDYFGCSVSLYGDTALIGACGDDGYDDGNVLVQDSGSVYVFTLSSTSGTFTQHSQLYAGDAASHESFACSVSLYGDTALIGALEDGDEGSGAGSVYVFTRSSTSGLFTQQYKLYASDAATYDCFGSSVSLHGNTALIGAIFDDGSTDNAVSGSGSVYVFTRSTTDGTFTEQFKLYASDAAENDIFGASVSLYGDTIFVGARDDDGPDTNSPSNSGSVYVFRKPQELYEDEDGWSLLLAYNHVGGEKKDLVPGTAPQSPTGYSHIWLDDIGLTVDDVAAVRFYCTSALHSRVAHWSTDAPIAKQSITNGILGPFTDFASWNTGTTKFSDHTADIPDAINDGWGQGILNTLESCDAPSRNGCTDLFNFPFYFWDGQASPPRHWGINVASFSNGFSCDDEPASSYAHSTLHQIWFKRKV